MCRVSRTCSAFTDRDTLLAYEQALQHASDLDSAFEVSGNPAADMAGCCDAAMLQLVPTPWWLSRASAPAHRLTLAARA